MNNFNLEMMIRSNFSRAYLNSLLELEESAWSNVSHSQWRPILSFHGAQLATQVIQLDVDLVQVRIELATLFLLAQGAVLLLPHLLPRLATWS